MIVSLAIAEITQLVEKITFRLARDTRVIRISSLFILRTMADDAGLHPFLHGVGSAGREYFRCASGMRDKQKSGQKESSHETFVRAVLFRGIEMHLC